MNVAVYCGSVSGNDGIYAEKTKELGSFIASKKWGLVFGASDSGLMSIIANSALEGGAHVLGVCPNVKGIRERRHKALTEYVFTETMAERRSVMIDRADAFIALPGGPGTLDEISEIICLAKLNIKRRPCILYNINGYYDKLKEFFDDMKTTGFADDEDLSFLLVSDDLNEISEFIENYKD